MSLFSFLRRNATKTAPEPAPLVIPASLSVRRETPEEAAVHIGIETDDATVFFPEPAALCVPLVDFPETPPEVDPVLLRRGFDNLSVNARRHVQVVLSDLGLHPANLDGSWTPETEHASVRIATIIETRSAGQHHFDLKTGAGVTRLFTGLRDGKFLEHLHEVGFGAQRA